NSEQCVTVVYASIIDDTNPSCEFDLTGVLTLSDLNVTNTKTNLSLKKEKYNKLDADNNDKDLNSEHKYKKENSLDEIDQEDYD
ncbi:13677_t:CDS:2, partial [Racocetra fulgida]